MAPLQLSIVSAKWHRFVLYTHITHTLLASKAFQVLITSSTYHRHHWHIKHHKLTRKSENAQRETSWSSMWWLLIFGINRNFSIFRQDFNRLRHYHFHRKVRIKISFVLILFPICNIFLSRILFFCFRDMWLDSLTYTILSSCESIYRWSSWFVACWGGFEKSNILLLGKQAINFYKSLFVEYLPQEMIIILFCFSLIILSWAFTALMSSMIWSTPDYSWVT